VNKLFFVIALVLSACFAGASSAQTATARKPDKNPDTFRLGSRSIRVPPPDGFTDIIGRIENDHGRFAANEESGLLAIDVPDDILSKLAADTLMPLDVYARVQIAPEIISVDITPEIYAATVSEFQKNFDELLDPNGKVVAAAKKDVSLFVSQVTGNISTVNVSSTKSLGYFQKTDSVFSALTLMTIDVNGHQIPMLASISLLRLNNRLINATVYKRLPTQKDIEYLRTLTARWTAAIAAANE
jgi:hypothetical protein